MAKVIIYTTRMCPYCVSAKKLFERLGVQFEEIGLDSQPELRMKLSDENNGWRTVPMIFINGKFIGGFDDVNSAHERGQLQALLQD